MSDGKKANTGLAALPSADLEHMAAAGQEIRGCYRVLKKAKSNLVREIIRFHDTFYEWDHYPPGDAVDWETHGQYYYHAHPKSDRPGEHGHFHTFMRYDGIPDGAEPYALAHPQKENDDRIGTHLISISMDKKGFPIKMFTVNRWVTDETWYGADELIPMLDRYEIDHTHPSWAVNRWLTAMFRLFKPQMAELIRARDKKVGQWRKKYPEKDIFEDRKLEVTSEITISVDAQLRAVENALKRAQD